MPLEMKHNHIQRHSKHEPGQDSTPGRGKFGGAGTEGVAGTASAKKMHKEEEIGKRISPQRTDLM